MCGLHDRSNVAIQFAVFSSGGDAETTSMLGNDDEEGIERERYNGEVVEPEGTASPGASSLQPARGGKGGSGGMPKSLISKQQIPT
jgi:hypothetical protein